MRPGTKNFLKDWLPPAVLRLLRTKAAIKWSGNYKSWAEAKRVSGGYESETILSRVLNSALKVKTGRAAYERDSVIFDRVEYSWPLLAGLMWIAALSAGELNILDFGGALGSSYFQNKLFLRSLRSLCWSIVEQKSFVDAGKKYFEDDTLKFFYDIQTCLEQQNPNAILVSGVIQYIEKPYALLEGVKSLGFEFIVFDRTAFSLEGRDRLTVQVVPARIYKASYPCWFFDEDRFCNFFEDNYCIVAEFQSADKANIPSVFKGFIMRKKQTSGS
jgi:putative methyltransferase (TIGR04325 family)